MKITSFDFDLPPELVAKKLVEPRDHAKMIVLQKETNTIIHDCFKNLYNYLNEGDLIVLNNTKVFPCVLRGTKDDGGQIEIKLASRKSENIWDCIIESVRPLKEGMKIFFKEDSSFYAEVINKNTFGTGYLMKFIVEGNIEQSIENHGKYFLPIYLPQELDDSSNYQTIYAEHWGSMQPPVAGMHFTEQLFSKLEECGIKKTYITMHIGRLDRLEVQKGEMEIEEHHMYQEKYFIDHEAADLINYTKDRGKRVIAIGTTVTRTLESVVNEQGKVNHCSGWTDLYIYPGYKFKLVNGMVSNLQPPLTTNFILACTFGGMENVMRLYQEAISNKYKFLEFGDCALYLN
jgi:S-adenosylmethionine:tRNA ribosyltransferase-isomerase